MKSDIRMTVWSYWEKKLFSKAVGGSYCQPQGGIIRVTHYCRLLIHRNFPYKSSKSCTEGSSSSEAAASCSASFGSSLEATEIFCDECLMLP